MPRETALFFAAVFREGRPLTDLIDADFSVIDHGLSRFYGINPPVDPAKGFQRVSVKGANRGGLLTHASVLAATSYPTRTSPVVRGAWVLETLLAAPAPPPPAGVPELEKPGGGNAGKPLPLRAQLEKHRSVAACAVCHDRIDPIGFALENYNAVGRFRTTDDARNPIDATATLPTGETIKGVAGLKAVLTTTKKEQFLTCLTEKLLIYALGRGPDPADARAVHAIVTGLGPAGDRASTLLKAIVRADAFDRR